MNDKQINQILREFSRVDKQNVPECISKGLDEALAKLDDIQHKDKPRRVKRKVGYAASVVALIVFCVLGSGFVSQTMAEVLQEVPVIGTIYKVDKNELDATAKKSLSYVYKLFPELKNYHIGLVVKGTRKHGYNTEQWDIVFTKENKEINTLDGDARVEIEAATGRILSVRQKKAFSGTIVYSNPSPTSEQVIRKAESFLKQMIGNESQDYFLRDIGDVYEDANPAEIAGKSFLFFKKFSADERSSSITVEVDRENNINYFERSFYDALEITANELNMQEVQLILDKVYKVYPDVKELEVVRATRGKENVVNAVAHERTALWLHEKGKHRLVIKVEFDTSGNILSLYRYSLKGFEKRFSDQDTKEKAIALVKELYGEKSNEYEFAHTEANTDTDKGKKVALNTAFFKSVNNPKKSLSIDFQGDGTVLGITVFEEK